MWTQGYLYFKNWPGNQLIATGPDPEVEAGHTNKWPTIHYTAGVC